MSEVQKPFRMPPGATVRAVDFDECPKCGTMRAFYVDNGDWVFPVCDECAEIASHEGH